MSEFYCLYDIIREMTEKVTTYFYIQSITGFMSDQKPSHNDPVHIVKFLNHPTAVITGTETVVRKLDMVAVYWDMEKTGRGHYRLNARVITDNASEMPEYAITDTYVRMVAAQHNQMAKYHSFVI